MQSHVTRTVLLFSLVIITLHLAASQQSVCYHAIATTQSYLYYVQGSYTTSYSCGFWGLSTCYSTHYTSQAQHGTQLVYHSEAVCCSGYSGNGVHCSPICTSCPDSHMCLAPYVCICPVDWPGDDCTEPPQNLTLTPTASDQLQFSWGPPNITEEFEVNLYFVLFQGNKYTIDPSSDLVMVFDSLTPFTTYNCCVAASTTSGPSMLACATQTTLESVPGDAPYITSLNSLNSTAVGVQWSPPLTPNGVVIFYTIYINGNAAYNITTNESSYNIVQNFTVVGLSPNQLVYVRVSASTKIGEGPLTEQQSVTTHESVPGRVEDLEVVAVNDHTIHVSWNPPLTPNGVLTSYEVVVENLVNATETYNHRVYPRERQINISSGFRPYVRYSIRVTASTRVGAGESVTTTLYTREGTPQSFPPNMTSSRSSATTASVEWDEMSWEDLRGWLVSYEIGYESVRSDQCPANDSTNNETVSVEGEMYGVSGLDPGLQYCVWVAGRTSAGVGPFSHTLIPWFDNNEFMLVLKRPNCSQWIAERQDEIVDDLARDISRGLELTCRCTFPSDYITDERLMCLNDTLTFSGRIISTTERSSLDLFADFEQWLSTEPTIIAKGESLSVVVSDTTGMPSETASTKTAPTVVADKQEGGSESSFPMGIVGGAGGGVFLFIVLTVALIIGATMVCKRQGRKTPVTGFNNPETDKANNRYSNYTSTMTSVRGAENEMPQKHGKSVEAQKAPEDYEVPVIDEQENIYEDPEDMTLPPAGAVLCNPTYDDTAPATGFPMTTDTDNGELYCNMQDDALYEM